jgi:hypothetical protein
VRNFAPEAHSPSETAGLVTPWLICAGKGPIICKRPVADYGGSFQLPRQEFVDLGDRMVGDLGEDGAEIGFGVDTAQLGGLDQRQDAGGALAALVRASEQPILASDGNRPD